MADDRTRREILADLTREAVKAGTYDQPAPADEPADDALYRITVTVCIALGESAPVREAADPEALTPFARRRVPECPWIGPHEPHRWFANHEDDGPYRFACPGKPGGVAASGRSADEVREAIAVKVAAGAGVDSFMKIFGPLIAERDELRGRAELSVRLQQETHDLADQSAKWEQEADEQRQRAEAADAANAKLGLDLLDMKRERDEAREAFDAVKEESAELQRKYSQPAKPQTVRCATCRQHEAVDKAKAEARALAKTARRYRRERDLEREAVARVREARKRVADAGGTALHLAELAAALDGTPFPLDGTDGGSE